MPRKKRSPKGGIQFSVRYPIWARSLSGGQARAFARFSTRELGEAWVANEEAKKKALRVTHEKQAAGIPVIKDIKLAAAAGLWLSEFSGGARTRTWYTGFLKAHILPALGLEPVSRVGRERIQEYLLRRREEGASDNCAKVELTIIRIVLNWAKKNEYQVDFSAWRVKRPRVLPKVTRRYDPDALQRFLAGAQSTRDRTALEVACSTGMRAGEIRAFDCSWIHWDQGVITLPADQTFAPKNRAVRTIPLFQKLRDLLSGWLGARRSGLVFPPLKLRNRYGPTKAICLVRIYRRAREVSGVPFQGMHDLRHHYVSWLIAEGMDPAKVQAIVGHRDFATTRKYMHLSPGYMAEARALLDRATQEPSGAKVVPIDRKSRSR